MTAPKIIEVITIDGDIAVLVDQRLELPEMVMVVEAMAQRAEALGWNRTRWEKDFKKSLLEST